MYYNHVISNDVPENLFESEKISFADLLNGQMNSPSFPAKYCTYTLMDYYSNDVLVLVFVNKRNTNFKSNNIGSAGFKKALDFFIGEELNIAEVITDIHLVIARLTSRINKYFVT